MAMCTAFSPVRIFMPTRSAGDLMTFLELNKLRKPLSIWPRIAHAGLLAERLVVALPERTVEHRPGDLGRAEQEGNAEHERRLEEERLRDLAHQSHLIDAVLNALELLAFVARRVVAEDADFDLAGAARLRRLLEYQRPGVLPGGKRLRHAVTEPDHVIRGESGLRETESDRGAGRGEPLS